MESFTNAAIEVPFSSLISIFEDQFSETRAIVAVKRFIESEEELNIKKIAMREIRMLKVKLRVSCLQETSLFTALKLELLEKSENVMSFIIYEAKASYSQLKCNYLRLGLFRASFWR